MPGLLRGVARTAVDRRDGHRRQQPRLAPPGLALVEQDALQQQQQYAQQPVYQEPASAAAAAAPRPTRSRSSSSSRR